MNHGEKLDGPSDLTADVKSLFINMADSWEVMITDRAYRKSLSRESAIRELVRCAEKEFLVEVFVTSVAPGDGA